MALSWLRANVVIELFVIYKADYYLAPEGVARYCFHPVCVSVCLCVCVSVCLCVCVSVCHANILVFYFSDIDLKFIQDSCTQFTQTNWPSYVKGQGHRDGALLFEGTVISQELSHRKCSIFCCIHLFEFPIKWNNNNLSEHRNDDTKIRQYLTFDMKNSHTEVTISHKIVKKNMAVIQSRSTHILYQCAKFGVDQSFNVIFDVCDI